MTKLGEILIEMGAITKDQLDIAIEDGKKTGEILGGVMRRMGYVTEEQLLKALATQLDIQYIPSLKDIEIPEEVISAVPVKLVWHYKFMPISIKNRVLKIALSNPLEVWPTEDLKLLLGYDTEIMLAPAEQITEAIRRCYGVGAETVQKILEKKEPAEKRAGAAVPTVTEGAGKPVAEASVIKLVDQIIVASVRARATDIHFENYRNRIKIRCRVDGILYDLALPKDISVLYPSIVSRIKILSGLDVVEKRLPQDGRAKMKVEESDIDLRVSVVPTTYGENIVIRILQSMLIYKVEDLGFLKSDLEKLRTLIHMPSGVIFLVGPTGSGKTTTLYAYLLELSSPDIKIITIEDPVEYELKDIMQIQVVPKIGMTFANCLRSILRHDPDIMMIGEVRDTETAELTIRSALTGHIVFSTLHTNDATSGVARLLDMNVEPFLLASSVRAFISQRLVRVICPSCKVKHDAGDLFKKENIPIKKYYKGKGCEDCRFTGYKGRVAIYELLIIDDPIRELIMRRASSQEVREKARASGMKTIREMGWDKVEMGITTPEEIMRVTEPERKGF
ncbi:MAG: type II/IV secretion system protein [Candidatus Omnitrophica bacterium]|nr:type II/IV secretion system protein [Candidatus Omnitrophota bacterium]